MIRGPESTYAVCAGSRRLAALQLLARQGEIAADMPIECRCYETDDAAAVSLAENSGRLEMHPVDEAEAYAALLAKERDI